MTILFRIQTWLSKSALKKALSKPAPSIIARTGSDGKALNCYSIFIDLADGRTMRVTALVEDIVHGLTTSKGAYATLDEPIDIPLEELEQREFFVTHYYGLATINYKGLHDFLRSSWIPFVYARIHMTWATEGIRQAVFNRRALVVGDRMAVLETVLNISRGKSFTPFDVMRHLYTDRWVMHPQESDIRRKITLYLDSFAASGELSKGTGDYHLQPKAASTLDDNERDDRRHRQMVKLQSRIVWLTWLLCIVGVAQAIGALAQAGVLKTPTLIDFTKF